MSEEEHRPTILLVGQGEPMQAALGEALRRQGVSVAASAAAELEKAVRVYAPDLVVLIGDAAVRGGTSIVQRMAANRATDVLPVVVVSNEAVLKHEGPDFRSGAVAIVPRGAGADSIARRLAELAREIPERPGLARGELNEHNLKDVVSLVSSEHKTGILSIQSPKGVVEGMPMVIETESPSAHNMEIVLKRLREAMRESDVLEYEFHEASGGRLSTLPAALNENEQDGVDVDLLAGLRMVILDSDSLRAERLAHVLHARGVQIAAADFSSAVIPRLREVDPQVIVMDSHAVGGKGIEFVRAIRRDPQLRWASMLVVRWDDFWPGHGEEESPNIVQLASRVLPLIEQDAEIGRRVVEEVDFDTRLELIGPGRLLRALGDRPGVRHITVDSSKRHVEIDIADNSILGAYATIHEGTEQNIQGMPALMAIWGMNSGRVSVREQDLPSVANIMMPVDEALGVVALDLMVSDEQAVRVDAETVPPASPEVEDNVTLPPGSLTSNDLEELRTMAPPRFRHLQAAGAEVSFSQNEGPTNKMPKLIARVETQQMAVSPTGEIQEHHERERHVDHATTRAPAREQKTSGVPGRDKRTEMGLAPVFEMLPDDDGTDEPEFAEFHSPTPPPLPMTARPSRGPLFDDGALEPELAPMLEGPATILAPAAARSNPAWLQVLLLCAFVGGGGLLLWQFALRGEPESAGTSLPSPTVVEARQPITGPAQGLEALDEAAADATARAQKPGSAASAKAVVPVEAVAEPANAAAPPVPSSAPEPPENATAVTKTAANTNLAIPTQNLPRDPKKASDVLVYRALKLVNGGELARAEATLDRAWELDPKNPQAMAGYATLYIALGQGARAEEWAQRAVTKRSRRAPYKVLLGDARMLQGDVAGARKAWRKALSQDPGNRAAKSRLAKSATTSLN